MYKNPIKVSKISQNQMFIPVILFWARKVVKKRVLWECKFGFSLVLCRCVLKVNFLGNFWGKKKKLSKTFFVITGYHRKKFFSLAPFLMFFFG